MQIVRVDKKILPIPCKNRAKKTRKKFFKLWGKGKARHRKNNEKGKKKVQTIRFYACFCIRKTFLKNQKNFCKGFFCKNLRLFFTKRVKIFFTKKRGAEIRLFSGKRGVFYGVCPLLCFKHTK